MIETLLSDSYYAYAYLDPRKPGVYAYEDYSFEYEPIYIGKGKNGRVYQFKRKKENAHLASKLDKIGKPIVVFLRQNLTEHQAFQEEMRAIRIIGRNDLGNGPLTNQTDGGEGASGNKQSKETIQKRIPKLRIPCSEEKKKKLSIANKGQVISAEQRRHLSIVFTGRKQSKETIEKRVSKLRGHVTSEDTKRKIAAPQIGRIFSEEQRRKMSEAHKGVPLSEEHKKAKSIAAKLWWAGRRAA